MFITQGYKTTNTDKTLKKYNYEQLFQLMGVRRSDQYFLFSDTFYKSLGNIKKALVMSHIAIAGPEVIAIFHAQLSGAWNFKCS